MTRRNSFPHEPSVAHLRSLGGHLGFKAQAKEKLIEVPPWQYQWKLSGLKHTGVAMVYADALCVCVYCIVSRQEQLIWNRDANSQSKSKKYGKTHSAASGLTLRANEFNCLWSKAPSQASPWNHPLLPGQILEPAVAIGECNSEGTRQGTSFSLQSCQSFSHANKTKTSIKFFILTSNC